MNQKSGNLSSVVGVGKKVVRRGGGRPSMPGPVKKSANVNRTAPGKKHFATTKSANRKAAARALSAGVVGTQVPGSPMPMKGY